MGLLRILAPGYIKEEWKDKIKSYTYKGVENSLLYNYVSSPLCNQLVKLIPTWVAPNVITVIGFSFNIINALLNCYYTGFNGSLDTPNWVIILTAVLFTLYYLFDLMDGKHARNTGQSSPLGLLMDHGCDAVTTFLIVLSLGSIVKLQTAFYYSLLWMMMSINFFFCTWEEYHTGVLEFPVVNGINEGILVMIIVKILTASIGQDFWLKQIRLSDNFIIQFNHSIVWAVFLVGCSYSFYSFIKVFKRAQTEAHDIWHAIWNLAAFFLLVFTQLFTCLAVECEYMVKYPKLIVIVFGFAFSKLVGHLQLGHISASKFYQWRRTILLFNLVFIICGILAVFKLQNISQVFNYLLITFAIFNFLCWSHFVVFLSGEMCDVLGIYRFSNKRRPMDYDAVISMGSTPVYLNVSENISHK